MSNENPKDWHTVKLEDLCERITVGHVGPMADKYVEAGIPFLRSQNIQPFRLNMTDVKYIDDDFHRQLKKSAIEPGDVVVVRTGYPGTACVVPFKLSVANCADLVIIKPSKDLNGWFLATIFNSSWGRGTVAGKLVGVAQQHFNIGAARQMKIHLPPLATQQKIAGVLGAYDELIENNRRRIEILEEMARRLYREWFVQFRFPGHAHVPLTDSPLGKIPKGWERKPLREIADLRLGKMLDAKKNKGDLMPYLANVNVRWGAFDLQNLREMRFEADERETCGLRYGDIVMCEGGEPGRCAIWTEQVPNMMIQKAIHRIRSRQEVGFRYLYYNLRHKGQTGHLASLFTGATIKHLPREKLDIVMVEVPTKSLTDLFSKIVEPMALQVEVLTKRNAILRKTRDLLLPRLISGELDVSELPIEVEEAARDGE